VEYGSLAHNICQIFTGHHTVLHIVVQHLIKKRV
jgi:hypothetical protein